MRKTPSWPRSWANRVAFYSCTLTGMHGQLASFGPTLHLSRSSATATLHGFLGSSGAATDFAECASPLPAGATVVREPVGGRSSNGAPEHNAPECTLPFYGIHFNNTSATDGHGVVFSIGWSGSWRMTAMRSADGRSVRVLAGLANLSAPLAPGQGFRGVRTLRVTYSGPDVLSGYNVHRRALSRHFLRLDDSNHVRGGLVSSWTAQTYSGDRNTADHGILNSKNMLAMTRGVKAAGVEASWIDVGCKLRCY